MELLKKLLAGGNPFDAIPEFEQVLTYQPENSQARDSLERALSHYEVFLVQAAADGALARELMGARYRVGELRRGRED